MWFIWKPKHERIVDELTYDLLYAQAARDNAYRELADLAWGFPENWQGLPGGASPTPREDVPRDWSRHCKHLRTCPAFQCGRLTWR